MNLLEESVQKIRPADTGAKNEAKKRLDSLAKPLGSLGYLEDIAAKMAGITGNVCSKIHKKNIVVMCADNGVVKEGVSTCPKEITAAMTVNFTRGITGVCVLADHAASDLTVVDIGVDARIVHPGVLDKKIAFGTNDIAKGPAMTRDQAVKAVETGIEIVDDLVRRGYDLIGTGEMGIGNTTTSTAVLCALSNLSPDVVTGKGAGLTDAQFENKKAVIKKALAVNSPKRDDVIDVLSKVGGFDIAGMCGCFIGAAKNRAPIVIDGFISSAAALCAYRINPIVRDFMFPSHLSAEPGAVYMMKELGLDPILNLKMRLGEGTGCALAFEIIEAALHMIECMGTFDDAAIADDFLVDIR